MKLLIIVCLGALLAACSMPTFVGDAPRVPITSKTPDHFELPARFAIARLVYNSPQAAGYNETRLWNELANRAKGLGTFTPLITNNATLRHNTIDNLVEAARAQRYKYLLMIRMHPATGSADVALVHVGSGGTMATVQAVSSSGGKRGFWGGQIRNPARLERTTLKIAKAAAPLIEEMLRGAAQRQH